MVGPFLGDLTVSSNADDAVGALDGGQTMRNTNCRVPLLKQLS